MNAPMESTCFVIMPFGDPDVEPKKHDLWTEIYEDIIVPAVEKADHALTCVRADEINEAGNIIRDVVSYLCDSRLVIADLSDRNPNVFYELGVRHALGLPTILIAQDVCDIPFDLRSYRTVQYGTTPRAIKRFEDQLGKVIRNSLAETRKPENPVADFIGTSRLNVLLKSLTDQSNRTPSASSFVTLTSIEERFRQLESAQRRITEELTKVRDTKGRVARVVTSLNESRERAAIWRERDDERVDAAAITGAWHGESGRMRLFASTDRFTGDYDWQGNPWAGHVEGALHGKVLMFHWNWDLTPEKGNGFFILSEDGTSLQGGWFMDYQRVSLKDAVVGKHDKEIHGWQFQRSEGVDQRD